MRIAPGTTRDSANARTNSQQRFPLRAQISEGDLARKYLLWLTEAQDHGPACFDFDPYRPRDDIECAEREPFQRPEVRDLRVGYVERLQRGEPFQRPEVRDERAG